MICTCGCSHPLDLVHTVSEVAKLRKVSTYHVRRLCAQGFWEEHEVRRTDEGVWLITNPLKGDEEK